MLHISSYVNKICSTSDQPCIVIHVEQRSLNSIDIVQYTIYTIHETPLLPVFSNDVHITIGLGRVC